jgi:hypothetical protein
LANPASTKLIKKQLERLAQFASVFPQHLHSALVIVEGDALDDAGD